MYNAREVTPGRILTAGTVPHQVIIDQDVQHRLNQGYKPPNLAPPRPPLKPLELKKYIPKRRK